MLYNRTIQNVIHNFIIRTIRGLTERGRASYCFAHRSVPIDKWRFRGDNKTIL